MKITQILLIVAIGGCLLWASHSALATTAAELYQEGLMKENADGDLEAAIEVYREIVKEHSDEASVAAKAQLHIGMCYEKLGRDKAKAAYQKVIERFPTETEVVQQARERLQALEQAEQVKQLEMGASPEKTRAMIEELDRKRERVQSYRASMTITMEMMGNPVTTKGSMLFKRPDRLRMETTSPMPPSQTVSIFDGKMNWTHQPQINMVAKIDVERIRSESPDYEVNNSVFKPFQGLDEKSIRYIRSTLLNGEKVYVFQANTKGMASRLGLGQLEPAWIEVWVGTGNGLTRRIIMYRDTGKEMMTMETTIEATNLSIPDSIFVFTPPEGVQVMDMTDMILNMRRQAKAKEAEEKEEGEVGREKTEAIMKEVEEKRKAVKSHRAQVTRQMQMMGTMMTYHTREWFKKDKSRQEMTTSMAPGETITIGDSLGVMWTYMPQMKVVQKIDMRRVKETLKEEVEEEKETGSFYGMVKETVRYVGKESLEGEDVHVFEGEAPEAQGEFQQLQPSRMKVWIGVNDGLVRKQVGTNEKGEEVTSEIRTSVEVNISIPDSMFVFTPPEGVQVMDFTENAINMARQMKAEREKKEEGTGEK